MEEIDLKINLMSYFLEMPPFPSPSERPREEVSPSCFHRGNFQRVDELLKKMAQTTYAGIFQ